MVIMKTKKFGKGCKELIQGLLKIAYRFKYEVFITVYLLI